MSMHDVNLLAHQNISKQRKERIEKVRSDLVHERHVRTIVHFEAVGEVSNALATTIVRTSDDNNLSQIKQRKKRWYDVACQIHQNISKKQKSSQKKREAPDQQATGLFVWHGHGSKPWAHIHFDEWKQTSIDRCQPLCCIWWGHRSPLRMQGGQPWSTRPSSLGKCCWTNAQ